MPPVLSSLLPQHRRHPPFPRHREIAEKCRTALLAVRPACAPERKLLKKPDIRHLRIYPRRSVIDAS
tara:strand:- start:1378 stop:1578 length:201 start_codon:yes stop_codon:yes gene_type:complete